ncbi:MAG: hypothetical protein H6617_10070 [Bdellovibrionaceae bacterium]|nr:hypothetical protein [Bdellovibrionales bacterium]MCB9255016.1 hypothetical protein [Pseudobdellovibrionaceae bacterium]
MQRFLKSHIQPHIQFFGVLRKSLPYHFWLLQAFCLMYVIYRFASRDYTIYGLIDSDMFIYPRHRSFDPWPTPLSHLVSFVFLYDFLPGPSTTFLWWLQIGVVFSSGCALLGIYPRLFTRLTFLGFLHFTGLVLATNSEIEGGTTSLFTLLILSLSPKSNFYTFTDLLGKGEPAERTTDHHWPIFLFLLAMSVFYGSAGLLKIIEVGPNWALRLHLERVAPSHLGYSVFMTSRGFNPAILAFIRDNSWFAPLAACITQFTELFFFAVLFVPRARWLFVLSMGLLHFMVYNTGGINFLGNGFLLLMCFDYNALAEKLFYARHTKILRIQKSAA